LSATLPSDFWGPLDKSILSGYAACGQEDYERTLDCYQTVIDELTSASDKLHKEKETDFQKLNEGAPLQSTLIKLGRRFRRRDKYSDEEGTGLSARPEIVSQQSHYPDLSGDRSAPITVITRETELAMAARNLGMAQQQTGDKIAAAHTFERAAELFRNAQGPANGQSGWCFYCAGLLSDKNPPRREELYKSALAAFDHMEELGTPISAHKSACLAALGFCLTQQGRQAEAFDTISRAIDQVERADYDAPEVPPFLALALAALVNGGVLRQRLLEICRRTGRQPPTLAGLPTRRKQLISLGITIAFFWFLLGSPVVAGALLILLLIHEMGHFVVARMVGVEVTPPVFTPLGAVITMLTQPKSCREEAYFAIAGPAVGTVAAFGAFYVGVKMANEDLVTAARYAFGLNLFNLIPLAPMDGGRVSMVISRKMWILGAALFALLAFAIVYYAFVPVEGSPPSVQRLSTLPLKLFLLYWLARSAWIDLRDRLRMVKASPEYFAQPISVRILFGLFYLGLATVLFLVLGYETEFASLLAQK